YCFIHLPAVAIFTLSLHDALPISSLRCLFEGRVVEKVSGDFEDAALRKVHLLGPRGVVEVDVCSGGKSASAVPLEHISGIVPAGPLDVGSDEEGPPDALLGGLLVCGEDCGFPQR